MKKYCKMSCKYKISGYPNSEDYCERFCGYLNSEIHDGCGFNIQFRLCDEDSRPGPEKMHAKKSALL